MVESVGFLVSAIITLNIPTTKWFPTPLTQTKKIDTTKSELPDEI